ncbi:tetratricopeptide repeat protein [Streptomyces sp. NPDC091027]|uniref:tetratricopeptide repeat protein n=1 Tax=Streptomyces sp. NPDC091027 TaxID=3365971 RepID=UPI0038243E67
MQGVPPPPRNSFAETLLGLDQSGAHPVDLFSRGCTEAFASFEPGNSFGYPFTQVFEPDVLREVALLHALPESEVVSLEYRPTPAARRLADLAGAAAGSSVIHLVGLAAALISVCRFSVAAPLIKEARQQARTGRERFEVAWLDFLVANRCYGGSGSYAAFAAMRAEADLGVIPDSRVVDMCTQAVVWQLKRREVGKAHFSWAVRTGRQLAGRRSVTADTASAWYRGVAMLPAAQGNPALTRRYMEMAHRTAVESAATSPGALTGNALKTYYESSVKEHMHLTRDADAALAAGHALVDLDPAWAPSHGELAAAYAWFGHQEQAAAGFERAARTGPPYVGHHVVSAARCRAALGDWDSATDCYLMLLSLAPGSKVALAEGRLAAQRATKDRAAAFDEAMLAGNAS